MLAVGDSFDYCPERVRDSLIQKLSICLGGVHCPPYRYVMMM